MNRRDPDLHSRTIRRSHADESLRLQFDFGAVLKLHGARALEKATTHVQNPLESFDGLCDIQVQVLAVHHDVGACPIGRVEHFGEVLWVPVFPPTHFGAVGVIHPTHVAAKHVVAAVAFLKIGTLAKPAVANGEDALGAPHVLRVKPFLHDAPSIGFQVLVHCKVLRRDAAN